MNYLLAVLTATVLLVGCQGQGGIDPGDKDKPVDLKSLYTCCGQKLMDSDRRVSIDTGHRLTDNDTHTFTVRALYVKFCLTNVIHVQLWRQVPNEDNQYDFVWEKTHSPTLNQISNNGYLIRLQPGEYFTVLPSDRLGLWIPRADKFSVPYNFHESAYTMHLSDMRLSPGNVFLPGDRQELDDLAWPRSFAPYIRFCGLPDCSDRDTSMGARGPPGPPGPPGQTGPAGPPGQLTGFDDVFPNGAIQCDVPDITKGIEGQSRKLQDLTDKVSDMQQIINNIYNSNTVTGICPTGYIAGTYGVGSCYVFRKELVPFGVAEIHCRDDLGAHLVSIETEIEDRFLKNQILLLSGRNQSETGIGPDITENYWTAGMYNFRLEKWVWYDESRKSKRIMDYMNWKDQVLPLPQTDIDICSTIDVNIRSTNFYWRQQRCVSYRYYICEIPKKCL